MVCHTPSKLYEEPANDGGIGQLVPENRRPSVKESFIQVKPVANLICGDKKKDA